jgi:hypothetical protein
MKAKKSFTKILHNGFLHNQKNFFTKIKTQNAKENIYTNKIFTKTQNKTFTKT